MTAKKNPSTGSDQVDETQVQSLLSQRQTMAEELHGFTSRVQAEKLLAPIFSVNEATQMTLLKRLVRERDADAADLLLALHELAPEKSVRKEARRGLIQLAGAKVYPSWTPEPEQSAVGAPEVEHAPRFWKGSVAEMRDAGELQLILCWEQGIAQGEARLISCLLDFWSGGIKDFFTEVGSKRHIEEHINTIQQSARAAEAQANPDSHAESVRFVDCTLAEGRRLINEALSVNRWRKTEPHKDFSRHLPLVQQLILHATEAGEDRGLSFIPPGVEMDMVAANFAGAWSMGDYGLCYDLLASGNPVREGLDRDSWVEMRRKWADEGHPAHFEIYFLREREVPKSTLWLPTSVLSTRSNEPKEIELGWSLELVDTQLSGALPEMPMGTAVYKETGRHWFWTVFSMAQEKGQWRIARIKDEGAAIQGLAQDELQKRIKDHNDFVQKIMDEHNPNEPDAQQYFEEIIWRTWQILSLEDALRVKKPNDKAVYEEAYNRAMSIRAIERATVYAEDLVERFPDDPDYITAVQRLGAVQVAMADRFASLGLDEQAEHFMELGETTLRGTLSEDQPLSYLLLAELLIGREEFDKAEELLLHAREIADQKDVRAQIEFDLASLALENQRFADAQGYLERVAEIAPEYPSLWSTLGFVHRNQDNYPEAEVYYKRAVLEEPADVRPYSELSSIYMNQSQFEKARDIVSQGIRNLPQSAHLRAMMSAVYLEQGDRVRSLEYLREAERLNPNLEIVQALREELKKK